MNEAIFMYKTHTRAVHKETEHLK